MPTTREAIVADARAWIGTLYKWGGDDESEGGVDCSGLIIDAYRDAGRPLPGRPIASQIGRMGRAVTPLDAMPGDVLYFDNPGPTDHVALYIGNNRMIEAPTVGERVRETDVRPPTSIRRILPEGDDGPNLWDQASGNGFGVAADQVKDKVKGWAGGLLGDWAGDAMKIGVYVIGGTTAAALVVVGVMNTVKK